VKYSRTNGTIEVIAEKTESGSLRFIVRDTGIGIPKHRIKDALEPFGQVGAPRDGHLSQGTGLGLPLAKAMAELHQGTLDLDSDEGKGTTVTVEFPAARLVWKKKGQGSPMAGFKK